MESDYRLLQSFSWLQILLRGTPVLDELVPLDGAAVASAGVSFGSSGAAMPPLNSPPVCVAVSVPRVVSRGGAVTGASVSVESAAYSWRVDRLRVVDAEIRFISAEPLLGSLAALNLTGIAWVITGGESGGSPERALVRSADGTLVPKADALRWVREIRDACRASDVAFFHKQWGGRTPKAGGRMLDGRTWSQYPANPRR